MTAIEHHMAAADWAHTCFDSDYEPLRDVLSQCTGTVLDLGGGAGVTRRYLRAASRYVSLDPSLMWLDPEWTPFTAASRPVESVFVQGTGEAIPLEDGAADAVLAFWSLNHVADPPRVCEEVRRVLKPRGTLFVVLEDMEPTWCDLLARRVRSRAGLRRQVLAKMRARLPGRDWQPQPDHVRIREAELAAWCSRGFRLRSRAWRGGYLTCHYQRTEGPA